MAAPPSAELEPIREGEEAQTDEQDMGMTYDVISFSYCAHLMPCKFYQSISSVVSVVCCNDCIYSQCPPIIWSSACPDLYCIPFWEMLVVFHLLHTLTLSGDHEI